MRHNSRSSAGRPRMDAKQSLGEPRLLISRDALLNNAAIGIVGRTDVKLPGGVLQDVHPELDAFGRQNSPFETLLEIFSRALSALARC